MNAPYSCHWCGKETTYEKFQRMVRNGWQHMYCSRTCANRANNLQQKLRGTQGMRVLCITTGEVFVSMSAVARRYHYTPQAIRVAIQNRRPLRNGLQFKRLD